MGLFGEKVRLAWTVVEVTLRSFWRGLIPRIQEAPDGYSARLPAAGQKGCASFLITKANTSESAGRSLVSLTTVGFILSEFLFHNVHETTHILIDR